MVDSFIILSQKFYTSLIFWIPGVSIIILGTYLFFLRHKIKCSYCDNCFDYFWLGMMALIAYAALPLAWPVILLGGLIYLSVNFVLWPLHQLLLVKLKNYYNKEETNFQESVSYREPAGYREKLQVSK